MRAPRDEPADGGAASLGKKKASQNKFLSAHLGRARPSRCCVLLVVGKRNCCPCQSPASRAKIGQAQKGGCRVKRGGLEGSQPLTRARRQHLAVENRHRPFGDEPATSQRSRQCDLTRFARAAESSRNHVRSGTCASGRPSNHAREGLKPLNYPGCKQRRPGTQAAEPRRAGAEQASSLFRGAEVAAMTEEGA